MSYFMVDDGDPHIKYAHGIWFQVHFNIPNGFNGTAHRTVHNTEFMYNYTGDYLEVWGVPSKTRASSWTCYLDNFIAPRQHTNNSRVCVVHTDDTLRVEVRATEEDPVWLDFIRYKADHSKDLTSNPSGAREFDITLHDLPQDCMVVGLHI